MKQPKDMTNEELDTELAELRGWTINKDYYTWIDSLGQPTAYQWERNPRHFAIQRIWNPTSSLDQCHEIEEEKIIGDHFVVEKYAEYLNLICHTDEKNLNWRDIMVIAVHATSRQKAEALLLTLREVEK